MIILTDCDGVLLSWQHSFEWWMKRKGYKKKCVSYCISEQYGIPKEKARSLTERFCESAEIGFLPPLKDAIKYVRKLHEEHGAVFHCITSIGTDPFVIKLREQNLARLFGEGVFERMEYLPCGADKEHSLERYRDSDFIWVEDRLENANLGAQIGLRSFLINHPYNENPTFTGIHPSVVRVDNWKDIYDYIAD
jgi:FMN phosphatase YigB (HAD superfamily)